MWIKNDRQSGNGRDLFIKFRCHQNIFVFDSRGITLVGILSRFWSIEICLKVWPTKTSMNEWKYRRGQRLWMIFHPLNADAFHRSAANCNERDCCQTQTVTTGIKERHRAMCESESVVWLQHCETLFKTITQQLLQWVMPADRKRTQTMNSWSIMHACSLSMTTSGDRDDDSTAEKTISRSFIGLSWWRQRCHWGDGIGVDFFQQNRMGTRIKKQRHKTHFQLRNASPVPFNRQRERGCCLRHMFEFRINGQCDRCDERTPIPFKCCVIFRNESSRKQSNDCIRSSNRFLHTLVPVCSPSSPRNHWAMISFSDATPDECNSSARWHFSRNYLVDGRTEDKRNVSNFQFHYL